MNKKFLLAGAALLGGLFAGSTTKTPTAHAEASTKAGSLVAGNYSHQFTARKPAPAKSTSQPTAQRQVVARPAAPGIIYGSSRLFHEKPHLRKVKYGKHRWILV